MYQRGFTLIELSIVLVIIGLIVGGVLVGQDLIKASEIRAQVAQIESVNTVMNTFRLKYNCLAGDCRNATQFFGSASQPERVTNGDGDGIICGYYNITNVCGNVAHANGGWRFSGEHIRGWDQLAAAGLIELGHFDETVANIYMLPGSGYPKLKINSKGSGTASPASHIYRQGGITFGHEPPAGYNTGGHRIRLGACESYEIGWNANAFGFMCGINPLETSAIDLKIDDGKPYSGVMVITGTNYIYQIPGWAGSALNDTAFCGTYATNTYRATNENQLINNNWARGCSPSIAAQF